MRKFSVVYIFLALAFGAILFYGLGGCSKKIVNESEDQATDISIAVKLPAGELSSLITYGLILVSAEDIDSIIVDTLQYVNGFMEGDLIITAGENRIFDLFVYGEFNRVERLIYQGSLVADVLPDQEISLNIPVMPVVQMINVTPHYQEILMGEDFYVNINIFNIPEIVSIEMNITYTSDSAPMRFNWSDTDAVVKGINMPANADVYNEGDWIGTGWIDQNIGNLTNINGNVQIARVKFTTHGDWEETATARIGTIVNIMYHTYGATTVDTLSRQNLFYDDATVFMRRPVAQ